MVELSLLTCCPQDLSGNTCTSDLCLLTRWNHQMHAMSNCSLLCHLEKQWCTISTSNNTGHTSTTGQFTIIFLSFFQRLVSGYLRMQHRQLRGWILSPRYIQKMKKIFFLKIISSGIIDLNLRILTFDMRKV